MKTARMCHVLVLSTAALVLPHAAAARQADAAASRAEAASTQRPADQPSNVPAEVRQAEDAVERTVRRYRIGVQAGVGVDPELLMFGAHGAFGPIFRRDVEFRPGIEFGLGEVTTTFGINLDVLYALPGGTRAGGWTPYVGAGPNFALSRRSFETDGDDEEDDNQNRFDFSDTDFKGGFNFIAGARNTNGMFVEMKATAYGVSNVRLLVGFNF